MTHANVPQNRERIFVVAFDPNQVPNYANFQFPEKIKLTKTIHDIIDKERQEDKYYYPETHQYYPELTKTITKKEHLTCCFSINAFKLDVMRILVRTPY